MVKALRVIGTTIILTIITGATAFAATVINNDAEAQTLFVTEGASKQKVLIQPGERISFCPSGCYVTFPNGDRDVLVGNETIIIVNGGGTHK